MQRFLVGSQDTSHGTIIPVLGYSDKRSFLCRQPRTSCGRTLIAVSGAQVISPHGLIPKIRSVLPAERRAIAVTYASADSSLRLIRGLETSSLTPSLPWARTS
jgi:hypothetical protein